jgi:U3 small nucleolar RNA-associated protein 4
LWCLEVSHSSRHSDINLTPQGPDASPIVIPLREFGLENQRTLPCLPQDPVVQSAPSKRLLISWWDREVHIWRISKLNKAKEVVESESESDEKTHKRKLVAKILIKGEANITSASVTANGSLLVVATTTDIKLFRLRSRKTDGNESLRVSKLDVPQRVAEGGARLLQFSPDGRWLILVKGTGRILSVPILGDIANPNIEINALSSFSKLLRIERKIEKRFRLGGLGSYERTINHITFSSDSHILAVSDLSGYVDTWVLNGAENLAGSGDDDTAEDASSDSSDDTSDSEDDESRDQIVQRWRRNPSASSLPKLPAAAAVLSFRPVTLDAPNSEYRLLAVTATSKIFEFEVLKGSLSSWSRSNPTAKFPDEFKDTRDQAMGCLWDVEGENERLWLYGTRWLFMFDLSRDFPTQEKSFSTTRDTIVSLDLDNTVTPNRKRKRSQVPDEELGSLKKGTSGAGGRIPDELLGTGMSRKMQRVLQEVGNEEVQQLDTRSHQDIDMLDKDSDDENVALTKPIRIKLSALDQLRGAADASIEPVKNDGTSNEPPHWWHTYKYRPIMGIVPIEDSGTGLEVALVERPEWELDLPPRYYGSQEWEKPGL